MSVAPGPTRQAQRAGFYSRLNVPGHEKHSNVHPPPSVFHRLPGTHIGTAASCRPTGRDNAEGRYLHQDGGVFDSRAESRLRSRYMRRACRYMILTKTEALFSHPVEVRCIRRVCRFITYSKTEAFYSPRAEVSLKADAYRRVCRLYITWSVLLFTCWAAGHARRLF